MHRSFETSTTILTSATVSQGKDLSFLLDGSIYHPLSQLEVPGPLRKPFPVSPKADTPLQDSVGRLNELLSTGKFLLAAFLAAAILASGSVSPTDNETIWDLLAIRFSCLELTGNGLLAAQEAKALEDLNSTFYFVDLNSPDDGDERPQMTRERQQHIVPFPLRLQALRLQAIGFSDARRGVSALYDLGLECREHSVDQNATEEERRTWAKRLEEIGIRVVNALIEMGDLDCARRTLMTLKQTSSAEELRWKTNLILLNIKIGDIAVAKKLLTEHNDDQSVNAFLHPLLMLAEGRYEEAAVAWERLLDNHPSAEESRLVRQNLAVASLYAGHVEKTAAIMERMIDDGNSVPSLVLNLATLYDLSSEKARDHKMALANRLSKQVGNNDHNWSMTNTDFKL